jgi:ABC-type transport system substrate-binding protein
VAALRGAVRLIAVVAVVLACGAPTPTGTPSPSFSTGGTLRVGSAGAPLAETVYADPAYPNPGWLLRCCLGRTILTYPGSPSADGGTRLQRDLATEMPTVSADGLSWTINLRSGVFYAPPYDTTEVTSADFVRALERLLTFAPFLVDEVQPIGLIRGAREFAAGEATSIAGLETPSPYALVVRLHEPYGALDILADVALAPLPAGVANADPENIGRFWASTGPYMYETYPGPADPEVEFASLVRNPKWDPTTDPRRRAHVERIEVTKIEWDADVYSRVESGEFDVVDVPMTAEAVPGYRADPSASARLKSTGSETIYYIPMNIAQPPFDDVAVRRALNYVIDRAAVRDRLLESRNESRFPQPPYALARHVFPDSLTGGLLVGYDPFQVANGTGDLALARVEMSKSRYDTDHDGRCDSDACQAVPVYHNDPQLGQVVADALAQLGMTAELVLAQEGEGIGFPEDHVPIQASDFFWRYQLTGSDLAGLLQGGAGMVDDEGSTFNVSLVGATPDDLASWGYQVTEVPTVDDVIAHCERESAHRRAACWAELDQIVTQSIVPWVPIFAFEIWYAASPRVEHFQLDQSTVGAPALDLISLKPGA